MRFAYVLLRLVTIPNLDISSGTSCSNGLPGMQGGNYCCPEPCQDCSFSSCLSNPLSPCCTLAIIDKCSATEEAPCIIDDATFCTSGVPGLKHGNNVCCKDECGTCGGDGCDKRPGGSDACCTDTISGSGNMCSATNEAPCIIDEFCSNGLPGVQYKYRICCEAQCGTCGGEFCERRPGGQPAKAAIPLGTVFFMVV